MTFHEYLESNADPLLEEALGHIQVVAISIGIALVLGGILGVAAHRSAVLRPLILGASSTLLTIPSLALFALAIPVFGLGTPPTVAALVLYALLPIVRNTVAGLGSVDKGVLRAAQGMGMGTWRRFLRIELPLAWPVILLACGCRRRSWSASQQWRPSSTVPALATRSSEVCVPWAARSRSTSSSAERSES